MRPDPCIIIGANSGQTIEIDVTRSGRFRITVEDGDVWASCNFDRTGMEVLRRKLTELLEATDADAG